MIVEILGNTINVKYINYVSDVRTKILSSITPISLGYYFNIIFSNENIIINVDLYDIFGDDFQHTDYLDDKNELKSEYKEKIDLVYNETIRIRNQLVSYMVEQNNPYYNGSLKKISIKKHENI